MCGIAGLATRDGLRDDDRRLMSAMLGSLAHRGPDDEYFLGDGYAWIGATRLAIIDVEGGRQPLVDESGDVIATQNGEIYNYVELRPELERSGHVFRTDSDTEVIAHLYEDDGPAFVRRLRGMFAIAIWDVRRRRLTLARDRLGKKPLYWRLADGRLSYGSELKAILADDKVPREVDIDSLSLFLRYQYVPSPKSILQGVNKLSPGTVLTWDGGEPRIETYWSPTYSPKVKRAYQDDVDEGLAILREAVRIRLRSDVPVGVFLSGGMDSSVVTALMAEASPEPVRTFSIGFENDDFNELPYARAVAAHFGTAHTEEIVNIDALELLPELAHHFDEPFADYSALPTFRVSQLASRHLKVVLTGDGGDEAFGGYTRYRVQRAFRVLDAFPGRPLVAGVRLGRAALSPLGDRSRVRRRLRRIETLVGLSPYERYVRMMTIFDPVSIGHLLRRQANEETSEYLLDVLGAGDAEGLENCLRADLLTYLPEDLLVKMDRATMANSLEARSPLLDQELVEFAARLPMDRKIRRDTTKVLLRSIAKQFIPAGLVDRPKMGFGVPIGDWFRGDLANVFRDTVLAQDAFSRDHIDVRVAEELLAAHQTAPLGHEHQLWALLMFELWGRRWLRPAGSSPDGRSSGGASGEAST